MKKLVLAAMIAAFGAAVILQRGSRLDEDVEIDAGAVAAGGGP